MSNLILELWEVEGAASAKGAEAVHAVQVLYNQEPVEMGRALEGITGVNLKGACPDQTIT